MITTASPVQRRRPNVMARPKPCSPVFWTGYSTGIFSLNCCSTFQVLSVLPSSTTKISCGIWLKLNSKCRCSMVAGNASASSRAGMTTENSFSGGADGLGAGKGIRSMWFCSDDQKLAAFQRPQPRQRQIKTQEEQRIFRRVHQGVRQKSRGHLLQNETFHFQNLAQRRLGQNCMVIKKIPIQTGQILDVRPHCNQAAAGFQAAKNLAQRPLETFLVRQVLKKIAGENRVQRVLRQRPSDGTVLLKKADSRRKVLRSVLIEVAAPFLPCFNMVDELTV